MGDDVSKILDFFDIWQAFCSRNLSAPGRAGGSFLWVRRVVSLSANCGIFRVFFSENLRPYNNAVKKKTVLRAFLAILSPFVSIRCDAEAGDAIYLFVRGANLWFIASSK